MVATPKSFKNPTEESLVPPIEQVSVLDPLKFLLSLAKLESTLLVAVKILAKPSLPSPMIKFPSPISTTSPGFSIPSPAIILFLMLAELSKSINILAGTSPSPDPGGIGLEKTF